MSTVALCCVAGGQTYLDYADQLMESAAKHFKPSNDVIFRIIPGAEGWPNGTMYRHHRLAANMPFADYVFLCDADMRFEGDVGPEILGSLTATLHPGYVETLPENLPYEQRKESACHVVPDWLDRYYCGGFIGGSFFEMLALSSIIAKMIDQDQYKGITPVWHDESALNKVLRLHRPEVVLDPSYCYPDNDSWYQTFWPEKYERKLVAIDKTAAERVGR